MSIIEKVYTIKLIFLSCIPDFVVSVIYIINGESYI